MVDYLLGGGYCIFQGLLALQDGVDDDIGDDRGAPDATVLLMRSVLLGVLVDLVAELHEEDREFLLVVDHC